MLTKPWAFLLCASALLPYLLVIVVYVTHAPWYASAFGRSFMLSKAAIVLLLSHVLVVLAAGDYPGRLFVWVAIFALLSIAGISQLVTLLRIQHAIDHDGHPRRRSTDHHPKEKP